MSLLVTPKTLERLGWPQLAARLRDRCRTPQAHRAVSAWIDASGASAGRPEADWAPGPAGLEPAAPGSPGESSPESKREHRLAAFALTLGETRERLAETSEARELIEGSAAPTRGGVAELEEALGRAARGGALAAPSLREVASSIEAIGDTVRALARSRQRAPRLAALAEAIPEHRALSERIQSCIDRSGELRDSASPVLRAARATSRRLAGETQRRLERMLQQSTIREALSDQFVTLRGDRYVLPVRSDARGRVPGIVHDASNSGTTLFVEPEAVVELNNRLKQAELDAAREADRILRELSALVAASLPSLREAFEAFAALDLIFARGELSVELEASEPRVEADGVFELPGLRHPLLPASEAVANDLRIGADFRVLVLSGPNAGGKTVAMKAIALAALAVRAGLHVPAGAGARVPFVDAILADIGDEQDIRQSLSTFSGHMRNLSQIVRDASPRSLVVLDEIGTGTDPAEGAALAQAILEALADSGANVVATTHFNLLKEMASVDDRFRNASVEFDPQTLAPTYRVRIGEPGGSSAAAVAARMGMPSAVLERANALLDREDRRLDRMLTELASARTTLERERREVTELRDQSRTARDEYRTRLEKLQRRRDALFQEMRSDLDRAFRDAHAEVAAVIRELQKSGGSPRERALRAAQARAELERTAERTEAAGDAMGVQDHEDAERKEALQPLDWHEARPGDRVHLRSGVAGVLESLPDRRGRVAVRAGSARLLLPSEQVGAPVRGADGSPERGRVTVHADRPQASAGGGGTAHCDLRGMRVEEALDRLGEFLDHAVSDGRDAVRIIHGIGTGALRTAVRDHMAGSTIVSEFRSAVREDGGEGVTEAVLIR